MAKAIMIQGTMSNAGKSLLTAGLCRMFRQDGYKVAPFKSQNMALNSYITSEGLEMGRAQAVQAEACGVEPSVLMNPILLKPVTDMGSQVIVNGEVRGNMSAREYYAQKQTLVPEIMRAYRELDELYDIIVIEGAGSPAEINLKSEDLVNMGMAKLAKAPVLLVGDIDRGGVFAQLAGTLLLLDDSEKAMLKGMIVNKFRGDVSLLTPGLKTLEDITSKPVIGVMPYLDVDIDDEDSLSERFSRGGKAPIDIAVIRLPKISNFTDFTALEASDGLSVRYITDAKQLGTPDMVVIPGTKSTISDMKWLRESGLECAIKRFATQGGLLFGICGGYQMLGEWINDSANVEGGGSLAGMGLLPIKTEFSTEKRRTRITGKILDGNPLSGAIIEGYEIHMGVTTRSGSAQPLVILEDGVEDGCYAGNIYGSYLHGFFDTVDIREKLMDMLYSRKGMEKPSNSGMGDYMEYRQAQYDKLAKCVRENLNVDLIYKLLEEGL